MQRWQIPFLGRRAFPRQLSLFEIEQFFSFSAEELQAIRSRRGALNRLGCALQVGFLRMTGCQLNSVRVLPASVLNYLGEQLAINVPDIASIRALYRRERTLYEHQVFASDLLQFRSLTAHAERALVAHLRKEAGTLLSSQELMTSAYRWLYTHHYFNPSRRRLQDRIRQSVRYVEAHLLQGVDQEVTAADRQHWLQVLLSPAPNTRRRSVWEWLQTAPGRKSKQQLTEGLEKLRFLQTLGIDKVSLNVIPLARLRFYAQRMARRKASQLQTVRAAGRALELVCFVRFTLLQTTDTVLALIDQHIVALWREARARAEVQVAHELAAYHRLVKQLWETAVSDQLEEGQLRDQVVTLLRPFHESHQVSRTAAIREQMTAHKTKLRVLLSAIIDLPFSMAPDHPLVDALEVLKTLYHNRVPDLPTTVDSPFAPCWSHLIASTDRRKARYAFEAATLQLLRRSLRNGSVWIDHSLLYRSRDALFIPPDRWQQERLQHYQRLGLTQRPSHFINPLLETLEASVQALAEAVKDGEVTIEDGKLHLSRAKAETESDPVKPLRMQLFAAVGEAQLPDVILEVDSQVRFSWLLLGRPARSERELLTLYAALLAQGTDLTARQVRRMVPQVTAEGVQQAMRLLETEALLQKANARILAYMQQHPLVKRWGKGTLASSDSMSLEATRHLWIARVDPRRRRHAVGMYTHVLDQWGIAYDQPIMLNRRQAGAAIEGAIRQAAPGLERVAVDTHGYTDFGMALAKPLGFDLCPRLAHLTERKLYVPRGFAVPEILKPIVKQTVSLSQIHAGWDGFVRIAASVQSGWCSAVLALERYGSAARGDPVYQAGVALGQLLRSLYLCDYLANADFRDTILKLLNAGESVHTLQRALYAGPVTPKRGRHPEELKAITGSLSLLANIIMAWNTHRMQQVIDRWQQEDPQRVDPSLLAHIAPIHHSHINLRGIFPFPLNPYRAVLLDQPGDKIVRVGGGRK